MATVPIDIVINITSGQPVISKDNPQPIQINLIDGDVMTCRVQLVKAAATGLGRVSVVSAIGLGCQLALAATRGGTVITSATALDAASADDFWSVLLPLNVAAVTAAAGASGADIFLEALIGTKRFQIPVKLFKQINSGAVVDAPVPDVALGKIEATATYVAKNGEAGAFQIFTTPSGGKIKMYAGDDDEMHWEKIA
jgi:hypothetical protein